MNSEVEFLELIQMARNHMEEYGFTYTSVTCYVRTWRSVYNFALSKGIACYSAELSERYMLEKYAMSIGENSIDESSLSPYMTQKVRAIRALTDFKLHGYVPKLAHGEAIDWPDAYRGACEGYMSNYESYGFALRSHRTEGKRSEI